MARIAEAIRSVTPDEKLVKARRRQIFQAACRVLARKSFHEASVKELALEAGLAAGSIYLYLDSKDEIIPLIAESMVAEFVEMLPAIRERTVGDPRRELIDVMRAILDVIDRYREAFNVLHHEGRYFERRPQYRAAMKKIGSDYLGAVAEIIERGRRLGVIQFDDSRSAVHAIHMLCAGWAMGANNLKGTDKETYWREIAAIVEGRFFASTTGAGARRRHPRFADAACFTGYHSRSCEMALYDRRTLDGVYSVRQSVIYIQNYRYAEERMMRMMAGWIALTPELAVKLEMAKQVYEDALHTDALGKRLPELRAQPQISKPPNDAFVTFMNAIEDKEEWEDTIERLVGIYRVLKPHLISHYSSHVSAMNPVYEPPTLRILQRLVEEEKGHVERGSVLLDELLDSKEKHSRAAAWQSHLEGLLGASGGVTGFESEAEQPRKKIGRS